MSHTEDFTDVLKVPHLSRGPSNVFPLYGRLGKGLILFKIPVSNTTDSYLVHFVLEMHTPHTQLTQRVMDTLNVNQGDVVKINGLTCTVKKSDIFNILGLDFLQCIQGRVSLDFANGWATIYKA